jgi:hypothetical protein
MLVYGLDLLFILLFTDFLPVSMGSVCYSHISVMYGLYDTCLASSQTHLRPGVRFLLHPSLSFSPTIIHSFAYFISGGL